MCYCAACTYAHLYNEAYGEKDKNRWLKDWISKLDKVNCRRCKLRISTNVLKAIRSQHIFCNKIDSETHEQVNVIHNNCKIARLGASRLINKKITRHLYKPGGIMMKKMSLLI